MYLLIQELLYLPICCFYLGLRKPFNYRCQTIHSNIYGQPAAWTCTRLRALRERIALSSNTCACAQDMSRQILRQVRMRTSECGCVQRCFSKRCIFRQVAARAERKVPRYSVLSVLKHGREIEGFLRNHTQVPPLSSTH